MTDTYMYVCSQQSGGAVNCHYYCVLGHVADNSKTTPPNVYVSGDGGYSWRLVILFYYFHQNFSYQLKRARAVVNEILAIRCFAQL